MTRMSGSVGKVIINDPPASTVTITDTGGYYTGTEVETALAEIGAGTTLDGRYVNVTGDTMTGLLQFSGTTHAGFQANSLTTTQRDALSAAVGMLIYNTTTGDFEGYDGSWGTIGGGAGQWTKTGTNLSPTTAGDDVLIPDSDKVFFGTGSDASILYNGTHLYIDPNEVGTGSVIIEPTTNSTTLFQVNQANATNVLTVDTTNGRVGIGTTGPGTKLEVAKPGAQLVVKFAAGTNKQANFQFTDTADGAGGTGFAFGRDYGNNGGHDFFIYDNENGANRLFIDSSGNVGIGTTGPTNLLSLGGNSARTFWMERHTTANTAGNSLTVQAGGATSGATDKAGGNLILSPGASTGTGVTQTKIKGYTVKTATGTADNTQLDRKVIGAFKALTNNTDTALVNCTIATETVVAGIIKYAVEVLDGTDVQIEEGMISYHATSKASTVANNTTVKFGNQQAVTAGTLTVTWTITAANPAVVTINANSSLTPSAGYPRVTYSVENLTQQSISVQ